MIVKPIGREKFNKLIFKDSFLMNPLPLASLPAAYNLSYLEKGEFPFLYNNPINYGKKLNTLPDRKYYAPNNKSQKVNRI